MNKTLPLVALVTFLLTACAGSIAVHSRPEGALISADSQTIGVSPLRMMLNTANSKLLTKSADGCYEAPPFTATWASGAVASSPTTSLCEGLDGHYQIVIRRPVNAPDLKKDLEAANQREEVLARRREARAINNEANAEEGGNPSLISIGGWQIY